MAAKRLIIAKEELGKVRRDLDLRAGQVITLSGQIGGFRQQLLAMTITAEKAARVHKSTLELAEVSIGALKLELGCVRDRERVLEEKLERWDASAVESAYQKALEKIQGCEITKSNQRLQRELAKCLCERK